MPVDSEPTVDPTEVPPCPKCAGAMWDNRQGKRNPRAPDFKCKDAACGGVIWPPREAGAPEAEPRPPAGTPDDPPCPVCGGRMWDDRTSKRNPRAPDFKCRNKPKFQGGPGCEGIIWPPRDGEQRPAAQGAAPASRPAAPRTAGSAPRPIGPPASPPAGAWRELNDDEVPPDDDDELPF